MTALIQPSFSSGEISPKLHGRVDLARYQTALKFLRNCIVLAEGGVTNRAGTRFIDELLGPAVLIPFIYSTDQAYMLVFTEGEILVFANGGFVQASTSVNITNVEILAFPPYTLTVTTSGAHGLVPDQSIAIAGVVGVGDFDINGSWYVGTVPSSTTFTLPRLAVPGTGSYSSGGVVTASVSIENPYLEADLEDLRFGQSADVLTIVHNDYPQHEFRRSGSSTFTFAPATYTAGPFIELNADESIVVSSSAREGTVTLTSTGEIFTAEQVGALFYMEQRNLAEIPPWEPNKKLVGATGNPLGLKRRSDGKTYRCTTSQVASSSHEIWTGTSRPVHDRGTVSDGDGNALQGGTLVERAGVAWEYLDSGYGIVRITAYTSATEVTALVLRALPDACVGGITIIDTYTDTGDGVETAFDITGAVTDDKTNWQVLIQGAIQPQTSFEVDIPNELLTFYTPPGNGLEIVMRELSLSNQTDVWAHGAWSEEQGYPSVVTYWQDRLVYAASRLRPKTVWGSKNGQYPDFGVSVPIVDDDAVDFTLNARQQNKIVDLLPLDNLIALTSAGAWKVTDGQNQVLTPSTVGFKPQSYRGAARKRGIVIGDEAIYTHASGRKLRTLGYTLANDKFTGVNLSALSSHLFSRNKGVQDYDYCEEPHAQLWVVRTDGRLIGATYELEQEILGFGRHDTAGGFFERVCSIPEDGDNAAYFVVRRVIEGETKYYLERLANRDFETLADAMFLDMALTYDGRNETGTTMTLTGSGWTVADELVLTASSAQFTADSVDDEIWLRIETEDQDELGEPIVDVEEVKLKIVGYTSSTVVDVVPLRDVPEAFQAIAFTEWTFAHNTFSGMDHAEGEVCMVLADGEYRGAVTIEGGRFTISPPGGVVHCGKQIIAEGETLDANLVGQETIQHRAKSIPAVHLDVLETRGVMAGPDRDHLEEVAERSQLDYAPGELVTGILSYRIPTKQGTQGSIVFRQDKPLPMTIRAVIPEVKLGTAGP